MITSYTKGLYKELDIRSEELKVLRSDMRAFGKVLTNVPLHIDYVTSSEAGFTDAKGNIALDGNVAQSTKLGFYRKADILKGVLLDEAGHNIWLPPTKKEMQDATDKVMLRSGQASSTVSPLLGCVSNLIDDLHNVTALCKSFPGFRKLHVTAVEHYLGKTVKETLAKYEIELAQGKLSLETTMNALIAVTKGELPTTGTLKKAADIALAATSMHETNERLAQSAKLTEFVIENALMPPDPEDTEDGSKQQGDQEGQQREGLSQSDGPDSQGNEQGDQDGNGKQGDKKEKDSGKEKGNGKERQDSKKEPVVKKNPARARAELSTEVHNLPEVTINAGMGQPSPIPDSAKDSLEDTRASITHDGNVEIRRHEKGKYQGLFNAHPEREHLALVTRNKIKAIKTKPGYTNPGFRRGKLQRRDVHKVATKKATPFSRPGKPDSPSLNIVLVTDWSGSMDSRERGQSALQLIDIMALAVQRVPNVDLWAMLYTTKGAYGTELNIVAEPGWTDPNLFGRFTGHRTPTLPALKKAVTLVPPNRPTIIILVTDGMANAGGDEYDVQQWIQDNRQKHRILSVYIAPRWQQAEYADKHQNCYVFPHITDKEITRLISIINREIKRLS